MEEKVITMGAYHLRLIVFLFSILTYLPTLADSCPALFKGSDSKTVWRLSQQQPSRGIIIVVHGLNTNPAKMYSIENVLIRDDLDVLHVVLSGHSANMSIFKSVSRAMWDRDVLRAYCQARIRANTYHVPLYYFGYSLGGLLGVDLLDIYPDVHYDKMIMIAPALSIHRMAEVFRIFRHLNPLAIIPGVGNRSYMANMLGTPVSAYNALFDGIRAVQSSSSRRVNIPTLVFIDPLDELISPVGLNSFIERKNLTRWQVHRIYKKPFSPTSLFHHLIIDPQTLGEARWNEMTSAMLNYLD